MVNDLMNCSALSIGWILGAIYIYIYVYISRTAVCCATCVVSRQREIVGIEEKIVLKRILNRMDS